MDTTNLQLIGKFIELLVLFLLGPGENNAHLSQELVSLLFLLPPPLPPPPPEPEQLQLSHDNQLLPETPRRGVSLQGALESEAPAPQTESQSQSPQPAQGPEPERLQLLDGSQLRPDTPRLEALRQETPEAEEAPLRLEPQSPQPELQPQQSPAYQQPADSNPQSLQADNASSHAYLRASGTNVARGNIVQSATVNNHYHSPSTLEADEKKKVLEKAREWLRSIVVVKHYARQEETYSNLAPKTGEWILDVPKFKAWLLGDLATFWGVGIPGAGKTFLTSFVIHHLRNLNPPNTTLYAYCRFDDKLSVSMILAALVLGCLNASEDAASYVAENLYLPYTKTEALPSQSKLETTLRDVLGMVGKCSILIDALDELQDNVREGLVKILVSFEKPLFLTSRDINLNHLDSLPSQKGAHTPISPPSSEFRSVVEQGLERFPDIRDLLQGKPAELEKLVEHIQLKSSGMLLLANLYMSSLEGIAHLSSLRKTIEDLPTSINGMYEATLQRINTLKGEKKSIAYRALVCVTYASRDLTVTELLHALATDVHKDVQSTEFNEAAVTTKSILISALCGLIKIEDNHDGEHIRLIHYTTYEFFKLHWDQKFPAKAAILPNEYHFQNPHEFMATICLVYLQLSDWVKEKASADNGANKAEQKFPLTRYAYLNLGHHTTQSRDQFSGQLPEKLNEILYKTSSIPLVWTVGEVWPTETNCDFGSHIHFAALHGFKSLLTNSSAVNVCNGLSQKGHSPLSIASRGGHAHIVEQLLQRNNIDVNIADKDGWTALHYALHHGHDKVAEQLLQRNDINVNVADKDGWMVLHYALRYSASYGHGKVAEQLLQRNDIDVNAADKDGWTILHYALSYGHDRVAEQLLQRNDIKVNAADKDGWMALHFASHYGHNKVAKQLLQRNDIDVNAADNNGCTALYYALYYGHYEVAEQLLQRNDIHVNAADWMALHFASRYGHYKVAEWLLQRNDIDVNAADNNGWMTLHYASCYGHYKVAEQLLQRNDIDVNAADEDGWTALHYASSYGHDKVAEQLLQRNDIDANAADEDGWMALHFASRYGHYKVAEQLLQRNDIDVNAANKDGWMALHFASRYGHYEVAERLLQRNDINVNAADKDGWMVLHYALRYSTSYGHGKVAEQLLQRNDIDVNAADKDGWTALHYALSYGHNNVAEQFLQRNDINVNAADKDGWTALHFASHYGHDKVAEQLLQRNDIDVNAATKDSWTALHYASCNGHDKVVKQLLQKDKLVVNAVNKAGKTPLYLAFTQKEDIVVQLLSVASGIDKAEKAVGEWYTDND